MVTAGGRLKSEIIQAARARGFHAVRFASVAPTPHGQFYEDWVRRGSHGEMGWMERGIDKRLDPRVMLPEATTAIALGVPYDSERPPDPGGLTGLVARYAWGRDYHNLVGKALKKLSRDLRERGLTVWGGVDTAPIIERSWASASGLGVTGKSCIQFLPGRTSWMFLAVLFIDRQITPDPPLLRDHCGSCTRCLDACPTDAYRGPFDLDARRCISYWTIEAATLAPRQLRPGFGRWVFGCDVCQEVCPHNHDPDEPVHDDLRPRRPWVDLPALIDTPDEQLMNELIGTPLRRPKAHGLKRNALIAIGNIESASALPAVQRARTHPSEVVRAAAAWASGRHGERPAWAAQDTELVQQELAAFDAGEVAPLP